MVRYFDDQNHNIKGKTYKWYLTIFQSHIQVARHEFFDIRELVLVFRVAVVTSRVESTADRLREVDAAGGEGGCGGGELGEHGGHFPLLPFHLLLRHHRHPHLLLCHAAWHGKRVRPQCEQTSAVLPALVLGPTPCQLQFAWKQRWKGGKEGRRRKQGGKARGERERAEEPQIRSKG